MTSAAPQSGDRGRATARRAAARTLHPDLGGDPEEFIAALTTIDRLHGRGVPVTIVVRHRQWRRIATIVAGAVRRVRATRHRYARW